MGVAYEFREGLRLKKWNHVLKSIVKYRKIRTELCEGYMENSIDLLKRAESYGCTVFPIGCWWGWWCFIVLSKS